MEHTKSNQPQQISQQPTPNTESKPVVTLCLASCEDCNGRYEDTTGRFKIQCLCKCHINGKWNKEAVKLQ
jgi:hypothetical protein